MERHQQQKQIARSKKSRRGSSATSHRGVTNTSANIDTALKSRDPLVRVRAVEDLGEISTRASLMKLNHAIHRDPNELVRAYAASSLGQIKTRKSVHILHASLRNESSALVKAHIYAAYVRLAMAVEKSLEALHRLLSHRRYHVRCTTAHLLAAVASKATQPRITLWLQQALRVERTIAAKSSLRGSLRELREK